MNFTGKISKIKFRKEEYNQALRDQMKIQVRRAVSDWLKAVIEFVPVSTGMARASLKPLGDLVDVDVFNALTIGNNQIRRPTSLRNPELGEEMGQSAASFVGSNQYQYVFLYDIQIPHYKFNEFGYLSEEGKRDGKRIRYGYTAPQVFPPWRSIEAGEKAFRAYMRNNLRKALPNILKFISYTKVSIDTGKGR